MAINEDQIRNLIKDYEEYREEYSGTWYGSDFAMARVYSDVIDDLKELLPRQTLADIAGDNLVPYVGTWVEVDGKKALIFNFEADTIGVVFPELGLHGWIEVNDAYPLDLLRVWNEDGDLVY